MERSTTSLSTLRGGRYRTPRNFGTRLTRRPFRKCTFVSLAEIDIKRSSDNDPWVEYWFSHVIHLLLLYALVLDVGVIGLPLGFIPHVFFADQAARLIGWPPGSPFQFEVGIHDGAWGLLGFLCLWIGGSFWLATGLGWSVFMLGATYVSLSQMSSGWRGTTNRVILSPDVGRLQIAVVAAHRVLPIASVT